MNERYNDAKRKRKLSQIMKQTKTGGERELSLYGTESRGWIIDVKLDED